MQERKVEIQIDEKTYSCVVRSFDCSDDSKIYKIYNAWKYLSSTSKELGCRASNVPEGLSETVFCRATGAVRVVESPLTFPTSFDTYDLKKKLRQEIKSTSVYNDLTSFSPAIRCDELYWIDLYNEGEWDGSFDIYKIDIESVLKVKVNKDNTFEDFQKAGKRPRISIRKEIVLKQKLYPVFSGSIGLAKRLFRISKKTNLNKKLTKTN